MIEQCSMSMASEQKSFFSWNEYYVPWNHFGMFIKKWAARDVRLKNQSRVMNFWSLGVNVAIEPEVFVSMETCMFGPPLPEWSSSLEEPLLLLFVSRGVSSTCLCPNAVAIASWITFCAKLADKARTPNSSPFSSSLSPLLCPTSLLVFRNITPLSGQGWSSSVDHCINK